MGLEVMETDLLLGYYFVRIGIAVVVRLAVSGTVDVGRGGRN